ncbi:hypothetical protein NXF25_019431 [Crotalus adamanteus]|uniref:Uncharacterized protein n=1 Tax=Crotalus adamanteus TaxID=8729 RepID=A0AAW1B2F8_CROAD
MDKTVHHGGYIFTIWHITRNGLTIASKIGLDVARGLAKKSP